MRERSLRLFGETDDEKEERLLEAEKTVETLARIERERVRVMEELAEVAVEQKRLQREMRAAEKEMKAALKDAPGLSVPEDRELTLGDVEQWMRSEFYVMAHTAPQNPHCYFSKKKVRDPSMYERAVAFILENGYAQTYGGTDYTVLDVELNGTRWFTWPMTDDPAQSEVLNLKPDSMRPEVG